MYVYIIYYASIYIYICWYVYIVLWHYQTNNQKARRISKQPSSILYGIPTNISCRFDPCLSYIAVYICATQTVGVQMGVGRFCVVGLIETHPSVSYYKPHIQSPGSREELSCTYIYVLLGIYSTDVYLYIIDGIRYNGYMRIERIYMHTYIYIHIYFLYIVIHTYSY